MTKANDDTEQDVLHVGPQNSDGTFTYLRHTKDHKLQIGTLDTNVKEGQPIKGDLVHLTPEVPVSSTFRNCTRARRAPPWSILHRSVMAGTESTGIRI